MPCTIYVESLSLLYRRARIHGDSGSYFIRSHSDKHEQNRIQKKRKIEIDKTRSANAKDRVRERTQSKKVNII